MAQLIKQLLIASANPGKVREFSEMLADAGRSFADLSDRNLPAVEETGGTFRANAMLKASHYAGAARCWALADDSGLVVDALHGAPGVLSARWARHHNAGSGDADNNALLIEQMENVADAQRQAAFVCVLALADPDGRIVLTAGDRVNGMLLRSPRGSNGFGYDPLFLIPELGQTTAELDPSRKHRLSHRGKALRRLHGLMLDLGL